MLLRGILLFLAIGILFFIVVLALEYFLWLNSTGRLLLLLLCIGIEGFLLFNYIIKPIFFLLRIKRGISNKEASRLIGKHFPEVEDKLYNLLDLAENRTQSELLLASIEQRSMQLRPIPFVNAINLKDNLVYLKYLALPGLIIGLIWLSGNLESFFGSYERVVRFDTAYEPPAPFQFKVVNGSLKVLDTETFTIQVVTEGKIKPEDVFIIINNREFLMQQENGIYFYSFAPPLNSSELYFKANDVTSRKYELVALETPAIQDFKLILNYPEYTNKNQEILLSTGNATFPEGTQVNWEIHSSFTESVRLITKDTTELFSRNEDSFKHSKKVYKEMAYQLTTSNKHVANYEKLDYKFTVIKDAFPSITATHIQDSLNPDFSYFSGEASDDYKINSIDLVCYPVGKEQESQRVALLKPRNNYERFYYTFPSGLDLVKGKDYSLYFVAVDNDAIHGGKASKSRIFTLEILDDNEIRNKQLEFQQSVIDQMDKSLNSFKEQKETLKEINREQKEKTDLDFNDQRQLKEFLDKQQQQEDMMQKFSKELQESISQGDRDEELSKLLKERLERQEIEARKNEKLLEELNKIADKIDKEELSKRLEELGKQQQNSERNLEQLLELTKRYYVTEKAAQLSKELEKQSLEQESLSDSLQAPNAVSDQEMQNEKFEELTKELKELEQDNQQLRKPLDLDIDKAKEAAVKQDQDEAVKEMKKQQAAENASQSKEKQEASNKAKQKQKAAAQKMMEMSQALQQAAAGGGSESTITEDAEMLRQILDNLITFSFKQEKLYESLDGTELDVSRFSSSVRDQQELRDLFEHIDDSLFALSLRRAELSEFVNEQITEVYYNIDKSLESIAEDQIYQGVSYQQYVFTAANSLADFLADLLDNMQQSMMQGAGSGSGKDSFQLPDIIKGQGNLQEKMGKLGKSGKKGSEEGKDSGEGTKGDQKGANKEEGSGGGKKGNDNGQNDGNGENEGGQGLSEEALKEIYEIYKEQQLLRQQLEKQLQDLIRDQDRNLALKLIQQMEDFENDLLRSGITERTLTKMNTIQHQLLKLENAALKQGEEQQRESATNRERFQNPLITKPLHLENIYDEIEILNRQALPLQHIFKNKVKQYFKDNDKVSF